MPLMPASALSEVTASRRSPLISSELRQESSSGWRDDDLAHVPELRGERRVVPARRVAAGAPG
jgi:hypothetical protein